MEQYINKDALVAEIEKWMTLLTKEKNQQGRCGHRPLRWQRHDAAGGHEHDAACLRLRDKEGLLQGCQGEGAEG